jgi:hypothetical protein
MLWRMSRSHLHQLLQLCVLRFGLLQSWYVRVRVLPKSEKVLIGKFCLRLVSRQFERSAEMQARQRKCDTSSVLHIAGLESSRAAAALRLAAVAFNQAFPDRCSYIVDSRPFVLPGVQPPNLWRALKPSLPAVGGRNTRTRERPSATSNLQHQAFYSLGPVLDPCLTCHFLRRQCSIAPSKNWRSPFALVREHSLRWLRAPERESYPRD